MSTTTYIFIENTYLELCIMSMNQIVEEANTYSVVCRNVVSRH